MGKEISLEEKIAGLCGCVAGFLLIYFYVNTNGIKLYWPLTWLVVAMELFFNLLLYVGIPALIFYLVYWGMKVVAESKVDILRWQAKDGFTKLKDEIFRNKKSQDKEILNCLEEIKKLKHELNSLKEELEKMNAPAEAVQEEALQSFLS